MRPRALCILVAALAVVAGSARVADAQTPAAWRVVPSPNYLHGQTNILEAVANVPGSAEAWAVGTHQNAGPYYGMTLIELWTGSRWQIVPSSSVRPNSRGTSSTLCAVAALSTTDAWAVGYSDERGYGASMVEHWNGRTWTLSTTPIVAGDNRLYGVTAISPDNVWAVGAKWGDPGAGQAWVPLIEHWNGTAWHEVAAPVPAGQVSSVLQAVTRVPRSDDLWAVGYDSGVPGNADTDVTPLIEHFDGSAWSIFAAPAGSVDLAGVAATGAGSYAVGAVLPAYTSYAQFRYGGAWSPIPFEQPPTAATLTSAAAIPGSDDAWAVGGTDRPGPNVAACDTAMGNPLWSGQPEVLYLAPNGATAVPATVAGTDGMLCGVTASAQANACAVGWQRIQVDPTTLATRTLILRYS